MDTKEKEYKEKIRENLNNSLADGFIPELREHKTGKVREIYFSGENVIMIATDRVSCFDHVLSKCIPYKGNVLNLFNIWAMENSSDIIPNAMKSNPDPSVIVQKKLKNSNYECVVRGYVWGSLASDYEKGIREKCGIKFPDTLLRYQKLEQPIFTPTTKAEKGHDEDITIKEIELSLGNELAKKMETFSIQLFNRGAQLAEKAGMIFIDTKYEFGLDENKNLYLIDESNTPDSSRYCSKQEYEEKFPKIAEEMKSGKYKDVSELIKLKPELKIKEQSKQFVRDVLIESGYQEGKPLPDLNDEQIMETAYRYIDSYEKLTGRKFDFSKNELSPKKRIVNNLIKAGLAYGSCVVPIGASEKDAEHWQKIEKSLIELKISFIKPLYASAHKQTRKVLDYIDEINKSIEPVVFMTFAGRSNGLGPVVAGNTNFPVITCPVFSDISTYNVDIHSSLRMPGKLPLMTVIDPGNAALAAKRILDLTK